MYLKPIAINCFIYLFLVFFNYLTPVALSKRWVKRAARLAHHPTERWSEYARSKPAAFVVVVVVVVVVVASSIAAVVAAAAAAEAGESRP